MNALFTTFQPSKLLKKLQRESLNRQGSKLGFGTCPNCKDSWYWKKSDFIPFLQQGNGFCSITFSVMICNECIGKPVLLNLERIVQNLRESKWAEKKVKLACEAIKTYEK